MQVVSLYFVSYGTVTVAFCLLFHHLLHRAPSTQTPRTHPVQYYLTASKKNNPLPSQTALLEQQHQQRQQAVAQAAAANFDKAYNAEGTPENNIISKFLNVVSCRVPEMTQALMQILPEGLVDNPEKFRKEFPKVVGDILKELKGIKERAAKEKGYKSRGLYDRVTNCLAGE